MLFTFTKKAEKTSLYRHLKLNQLFSMKLSLRLVVLIVILFCVIYATIYGLLWFCEILFCTLFACRKLEPVKNVFKVRIADNVLISPVKMKILPKN